MSEDIEKFFKKNKRVSRKVVKKNFPSVSIVEKEEGENKKSWKKISLAGVVIVLVLSLLGVSVFFYEKYKGVAKNSNEKGQGEVQEILGKLNQFIELPKEEPRLATISDKEKLADQPFFKKAENGDKLLIFSAARLALIYRPSTGKMIEISSLYNTGSADRGKTTQAEKVLEGSSEKNQIGDSREKKELSPENPLIAKEETAGAESQDETKEEKKISVSVYNATGKNGVAAATAEKISEIPGVEIKEKETAEKIYEKTVIVDFSGENSQAAKEIAEIVGGSLGEIPEGEKIPPAEILIVVGKESLEN